ncbi:MAG: response regulator transcription factor, partial [Chloroflexota bacterium]|nr:response regulator transcription factor [Chloroflexota bacterium]
VADGARAMAAVDSFHPDLIVLDVMLPNRDGLEICRELRATHGGTPVIMLTARGEETDKILGLGLGADDYVTKPFSPGELVARVKAVLRRTMATTDPTPAEAITAGDLRIDLATRRVLRGDVSLDLTAKEFDLLAHMAAHPGRVYTRESLLRDVWGYDFYGDDSTVTVHVRRLREKLEPDPAKPRYLTTVWGVGYRFEV